MATLHAPLVCGSLPSCRRLSSQRFRQRRVVAVPSLRRGYDTLRCRAEAGPGGDSSSGGSSVEETTRKWGLEAGLWKVFTSKETSGAQTSNGEKMSQAKDLLKRYGSAYLITSISLSLVSFSLSYVLISAGVDVASLLDKARPIASDFNIGISVTSTSEQVGVFALAYAVHKAASPIRFPPTVALTPIVARWMGKNVSK